MATRVLDGIGLVRIGDRMMEQSPSENAACGQILTPEQIAHRIGGVTVKSLCELIRKNQLETTTLGFAPPSRRGGPPRRLWGMTDSQFQALLDLRERRARERTRS